MALQSLTNWPTTGQHVDQDFRAPLETIRNQSSLHMICDPPSSRPSESISPSTVNLPNARTLLSTSPAVEFNLGPTNSDTRDFRYDPTGRNNWESYSKRVQSEDGQVTYICLWKIQGRESSVTCKYKSKKQLVKRHILNPSCVGGLSRKQKSHLETHIATHSGNLPLICRYQCGKAYSDPARRHRHYVGVHGYVPKKYKKKFKAPVVYEESVMEEEEESNFDEIMDAKGGNKE
ncbi:hypothetical protein H0H81_007413 [Sphagnurus paluster]|uniref:C2H2-type domain-containing protein n=1 Tax=Sphagnurus paluster TaxID=117069 RepID=A0A9P7K6A5_9AGAR|nr:hypothetical protein H0H81_007413 [Sphagnurus paluster]